MNYTITLYIILLLLLLWSLFMWERNTRIRKQLISQRKTNQYVLGYNRRLFQTVETNKETISTLTAIVEFQEAVIKEFRPQHSDERPVVDFPLQFEESVYNSNNVELGRSTLI